MALATGSAYYATKHASLLDLGSGWASAQPTEDPVPPQASVVPPFGGRLAPLVARKHEVAEAVAALVAPPRRRWRRRPGGGQGTRARRRSGRSCHRCRHGVSISSDGLAAPDMESDLRAHQPLPQWQRPARGGLRTVEQVLAGSAQCRRNVDHITTRPVHSPTRTRRWRTSTRNVLPVAE